MSEEELPGGGGATVDDRGGGRLIAMWSGPRNLSTAMMRAWENRPDTEVIDEPFYAHYLAVSGIDHPMRDAVIASGEIDWRRVVERITTAPERGIVYQKHITTHWLEHFTLEWLDALDHAFLIRAPEPVVASYARKRERANAADLGYAQQAALFDAIGERRGAAPPVIDSARFLRDPQGQLRALCERLEVPFDPAMLSWPAGPRASDGVWSAHWYDAVRRSTGFGPPRDDSDVALDADGERLAAACRPYYDALAAHAL